MSKFKKFLLILALFVGNLAANAAEIYQCKDAKGRSVFSQTPCGKDATKKTIQGPAELGTVIPDGDPAKRLIYSNERRELDRKIASQKRYISGLQSSMDRDLAGLRAKKSQANNNLAGAQWEQSISTEMQAVTERYRSKISIAENQLDRLLTESAELGE
jgi:hypothetical protein